VVGEEDFRDEMLEEADGSMSQFRRKDCSFFMCSVLVMAKGDGDAVN
jgi:hypothetical protein